VKGRGLHLAKPYQSGMSPEADGIGGEVRTISAMKGGRLPAFRRPPLVSSGQRKSGVNDPRKAEKRSGLSASFWGDNKGQRSIQTGHPQWKSSRYKYGSAGRGETGRGRRLSGQPSQGEGGRNRGDDKSDDSHRENEDAVKKAFFFGTRRPKRKKVALPPITGGKTRSGKEAGPAKAVQGRFLTQMERRCHPRGERVVKFSVGGGVTEGGKRRPNDQRGTRDCSERRITGTEGRP